jgi:AcrR family transcriptional regulator
VNQIVVDREDILGAAQRQLNRDAGSSMAVVAKAAGVGRATLHRHFASREALLTEIGTRSLDRWESRLRDRDVAATGASGDAARIAACLHGLVADFVADADDFGFALTDSYMCTEPALKRRADLLFEQEIAFYAAAQAAGVLRADVPARWVGHSMYGQLIAARDALRDGDVARRDLDALVLSTFLTGSGPR